MKNTEDAYFIIEKIESFCDEVRTKNTEFHSHNYYSVYWIKSGSAVHATTYVEHPVHEGELFFVPLNLKHRMIIEQNTMGVNIHFNTAFYNLRKNSDNSILKSELFYNDDFKTIIKPNDKQTEYLSELIKLMLHEKQEQYNYSETGLFYLLNVFLLHSLRILEKNKESKIQLVSPTEHLIIRFKQLIDENYVERKDVSYYAHLLNVSAVRLNEITKQTSGITAGELIRSKVIDEASKLLYSTDLSAKEIAYQLGFDDPAYFSRFFKKYTDASVTDYRERIKKVHH